MSEITIKKNSCSYCGESPVNHNLCYAENLISSVADSHMMSITKYAPRPLKDFASWIPIFLFNTLKTLGLASYSSDVEKTNSFRSRVIWDEAIKRGITMEQIVISKRPIDWYRAKINNKTIYFESIPIQSEFLDFKKDWDDKIILKKELQKHNIPVPKYKRIPLFTGSEKLKKIFSGFDTPVIVKPQLGSRGRHTTTNINNFSDFNAGIYTAKQITPYVIVEEHLKGYVCRATLVGGVLAGFYRALSPYVEGDGKKKIIELIKEKNNERVEREHIVISEELNNHILRSGFTLDDIIPKGTILPLTHRTGRLFGGTNEEMPDKLHPSFVPIIERAAKVVGLPVVGFDCIIPDPTKDEKSQRWGIIECNTLPFIDMHYYALIGKPRNIAGMIWDLWN